MLTIQTASILKWSPLNPKFVARTVHVMKKEWMWAAIESPSFLHAQIFGVFAALRLLRSSPLSGEKTLSLRHQTESIAQLQHELEQLKTQRPKDGMLLAVLALAAHGEPLQVKHVPKGYPDSPLSKPQNMQIYGMMEMVPEHIEASYILLNLFGGLDGVRMFGLQETVEL